jgi:hypothetical protein
VPGNAKLAEYSFPPFETISGVLADMRVQRDFEADAASGLRTQDSGLGTFRHIHRRDGDTDIYFVANPETNWIGTTCAFRVSGKVPELWQPLTGEIRQQAIYEQRDGRTFIPLSLEPSGSIFVVFRKVNHSLAAVSPILSVERAGRNILPIRSHPEQNPPAIEVSSEQLPNGKPGLKVLAWESGPYALKQASGTKRTLDVPTLPAALELSGAWEVRFQPNRGAPEKITLDGLTDWSKHPDPRVQHFSGAATYTKAFTASSEDLGIDRRLYLDLGRVAIIAQVKLNGRDLGTWWKPPFRADVTEALKPGENRLEVQVVNLWINRMIGDEQLPDDSARNPNGTLKEWPAWVNEGKSNPGGRFTFTSWRLWKKDSPLQESGLLGPVRLVTAWETTLPN